MQAENNAASLVEPQDPPAAWEATPFAVTNPSGGLHLDVEHRPIYLVLACPIQDAECRAYK